MKKKGIKNRVTPWEVKGSVNYDKLVKEFGVERINEDLLNRIKKHTKELHFMLRRNIFFAHRDLHWLLDEYEKGNKFFLYTGCGPSGPIHLGHIGTWMFTKWLQETFDVELWFQFTDDEKFLFKKQSLEEIQQWMHENMLDVIALGFNPKKTHFIINTKHAHLLYPIAIRIAKKITFSMVKASFGLREDSNIGQLFYTSMQAAPAVLPSVLKNKNIPCLIPHAIDQDPHFRLTRDILPKLGYYKPASIQNMFLPPLTGVSGKMSSSENNGIFTTDTKEEVKNKINKYAFSGGQPTLEEHKLKGGDPEIDVSFQYLRMLLEEEDEKLNKIYENYKSGKLSTGELKKYTIEKINVFLEKHQKEREKAKKKIDDFVYKG
ncbi:tryptophan--tRNA ligase [Candidatus Pacearchaeota archaeon]|nr:tryptophan--tRNA ligase [Candidatus Pacearchaeota archaeon]